MRPWIPTGQGGRGHGGYPDPGACLHVPPLGLFDNPTAAPADFHPSPAVRGRRRIPRMRECGRGRACAVYLGSTDTDMRTHVRRMHFLFNLFVFRYYVSMSGQY